MLSGVRKIFVRAHRLFRVIGGIFDARNRLNFEALAAVGECLDALIKDASAVCERP
jgi:hypothetical protein